MSRVTDDWGLTWTFATQTKLLTDKEMATASAEFFAKMAAAPAAPAKEDEEVKSPSGRSKRGRKEEAPAVQPAEAKETRTRPKRGKA
jgi:hypothetical protein